MEWIKCEGWGLSLGQLGTPGEGHLCTPKLEDGPDSLHGGDGRKCGVPLPHNFGFGLSLN